MAYDYDRNRNEHQKRISLFWVARYLDSFNKAVAAAHSEDIKWDRQQRYKMG